MTTRESQRPLLRRIAWNPIAVAFPLGWFVMRVSTAGFTTFRTIGLCGVTLWFVLAVSDHLTGHRLTDWIYSDDEGGAT